LKFTNITAKVGKDMDKWQSLLQDIKKSRGTIDTTKTSRTFGPIEIHYGKVQAEVILKYDYWYKEILNRFGTLIGENMRDFFNTISKARNDLESHSVDASSTTEAVQFISLLQYLNRELKGWESQVEGFHSGQKILERNRFQFPSNWLDVDNIDGEWGAFNDILKRKDSAMQSQVGHS
jgi:dynein heavy chain 1